MTTALPEYHAANQQRARESAVFVLRGIALNLGLALVKFSGGFFGHTYALIADGAESLLDALSSLLVWGGFRVASRPPDANHPYGHGKAEPLAALSVGIVIFGAVVWIGWHAVLEIMTPHRGPHWATLPLLAGVVGLKIWFSRRMRMAGENANSTALGLEAVHHLSDAITSAAAFVGISIALWGGPGYETADDWAALVACVVIAFNGVAIFQRALGDVMDVAVPAKVANDVRQLARGVPGVRELDKLRVRKSGLSYLVDIQVRVDGDLTVREGHDIAHAVKDALLHSTLRVTDVSVHIEPVR